MVQTQNLSFQYSSAEEVIYFPDIHLDSGENLLVLGKSGIGKTTLLHLMAGLLKPKTGVVSVNDVKLKSISSRKRDRFVGQNIGLVFQKNYTIRSLNVLENLQTRVFFSRNTTTKKKLLSLLEELGLLEHKHKKVNQLSEGQLQRLGIALAVINEPKVILADEPTSSLDDENCNTVMKLLLRQAERQKANLIVITHDYRVKPLFKKVVSL